MPPGLTNPFALLLVAITRHIGNLIGSATSVPWRPSTSKLGLEDSDGNQSRFGAALIFLLYLLPWHNLPSVQIPLPSPESLSHAPHSSVHSASHLSGRLTLGSEVTSVPGLMSYREIRETNVGFNASGSDVLVILHIQKTGGTSFEKHIVQDLQIKQPCICWKRRKRCKCPRPGRKNEKPKNPGGNSTTTNSPNTESWLFSRFSTGWICGLHADWTELTSCVDAELERDHGCASKRRYFYVTMIRDPIHRFLSEYRHVKRGATWKASRHLCNGKLATAEEIGNCYPGRTWTGVTLADFLNCPYNLAFNRQTRMLADLSLVGCYNKSYMPEEARNRVILASAKRNLEFMAFVGLTENQRISQYVFEETFRVRFRIPFTQNEDTYSKATLEAAKPDEVEMVRKVNSLDLELYDFAAKLLHTRFEELKKLDQEFDDHYNYLGEEKGHHFSWDDVENEDK
ncbi:unnamed protein product [Allacma fusca]|uniref:Heparan-sulfate 6-O-sulfotransferase n=1 Tax=Allacma fusca TaxID=39272 RepID=A0A8J2KDX5_9HEXA|nr:unnamed protein product [Allacma fusca]